MYFYSYCPICFHGRYLYYPLYRPEGLFPPVETTLFEQSLRASRELFNHGQTVVDDLAASETKMLNLMNAAQAGDDKKVDQIVQSTGVPVDVETTYTPTSVTFRLRNSTAGIARCCTLTINLVWTDY
ncbi:hypothetical protein JSY36_19235 [Bacillus sp. H-16]|uniref:hypothetical protein n=1 Tax=Alteribacter salitolerans TaxID=2912333 RepID=UPI001966A418|nr:hypothetical protein [Alteribacter salitolerans]MBM7097875.1 hypothetical protein [Alteribacter salitolerans]